MFHGSKTSKFKTIRKLKFIINEKFCRDRNQPIVNNQRISVKSDGTLEINAVRASDVGKYTCMVSSAAGNHSRSATLVVV